MPGAAEYSLSLSQATQDREKSMVNGVSTEGSRRLPRENAISIDCCLHPAEMWAATTRTGGDHCPFVVSPAYQWFRGPKMLWGLETRNETTRLAQHVSWSYETHRTEQLWHYAVRPLHYDSRQLWSPVNINFGFHSDQSEIHFANIYQGPTALSMDTIYPRHERREDWIVDLEGSV